MVEASHPSKPGEDLNTGHEPSDLKPKNIALFGATLAVTIIGVLLVSYWLFHRFYAIETRNEVPPSPLSYLREPAPGPRLLVNPGRDLKEMRAEEDSVLNHYGWVDRKNGVVRIPIDRAIEILAERGLPARQKVEDSKQMVAGTEQQAK